MYSLKFPKVTDEITMTTGKALGLLAFSVSDGDSFRICGISTLANPILVQLYLRPFRLRIAMNNGIWGTKAARST